MNVRRSAALSIGALCLATLVSCGDGDEDAAAPNCDEILRAAAYETMRQLAAAGLAASPDELRVDAPEGMAGGRGDSVHLPTHEVWERDFTDAERESMLSRLTSTTAGVGAVFDAVKFHTSVARSDLCAD
jgi:hypothetical protein